MTTTLDDIAARLERIEAALIASAPHSRERWLPIGASASIRVSDWAFSRGEANRVTDSTVLIASPLPSPATC